MSKKIKYTKDMALIDLAMLNQSQGDAEIAHCQEDDMRDKFIQSCANGDYMDVYELTEIGRIVASSSEIKFDRYCS